MYSIVIRMFYALATLIRNSVNNVSASIIPNNNLLQKKITNYQEINKN